MLLAVLPSTCAAVQANLGALAQTQAELSVYRWPQWPLQDAVRRSPQVDLAPAIARYAAALSLDPANVTANRRLGQIELSRGEYDAARSHLAAAYRAAPWQRPVRQMLGESYAVAGEIDPSATLWHSLYTGQDQLAIRQWWYQHIEDFQRAGWIGQAMVASLALDRQPGLP